MDFLPSSKMTFFESPVFWQCLLCGLCGYLVALWVHVLFRVPSSIVKALAG